MAVRRAGDVLAAKYRIDDLLGSGGMGDVYRATNTLVGRAVALKLLHPQHAENPDVVERFVREAKVANMLRHPNVVDVIDIDRDDDGVPFIVQEMLVGEDLAKYVQRTNGTLTVDEIETLIVPIIDAIAYAHSQDIIHRDIKPANVFLAKVRKKKVEATRVEGNAASASASSSAARSSAAAQQITEQIVPKLLDFGISKLRATGIKATDAGVLLGTPAYMAPELLTGARDAGPASDVWSIGVMLFELLVGRRPFDATGPNIYVLVATTDAPPIRDLAPEIAPELAQVVDKCLKRNTLERYDSAVDLSRDLSAAVNQARLRTPEPILRRPAALPVAHVAAVVVPDLDLPSTQLLDNKTVVDATAVTKIQNPVSARTVMQQQPSTPPPTSGERSIATTTAIMSPPPSHPPPISIAPVSPPLTREAPSQPRIQQPPILGTMYNNNNNAPPSRSALQSSDQDHTQLVGVAAMLVISAVVMAVCKGILGRPGGFAVARPFVDLNASMNTAAQAGCALVLFVVAVRAFRRGLIKWNSGERAVAALFAGTCGLLFFATWELARAAF